MSVNRRAGKAKQIAWRDGWDCAYCGLLLNEASATVDHVLPICAGGDNRKENLVLACHRCNRQKSNSSLLSFLLWKHRPRHPHDWAVRLAELFPSELR